MTFSELDLVPQKTKLCSCITSTANSIPGHEVRLRFLDRLRRELSDRIDFFGRGVQPIPDKEVGLAPYRYHVALENSAVPHYWTEKLADPFLRNCFPIYYGAPNIGEYFDTASLAVIDINEPDVAIARIARILDTDADVEAASAIAAAKHQVMWEHNLLARLDRLMGEAEASGVPAGAFHLIQAEHAFWVQPWHLSAHEGIKRSLRRFRRRFLPYW
jgi:hypothetical protein